MFNGMAFGVFLHRTDSIYDDVPSERYQFPKQYLSRARECEGDWIVYLEPSKVRDTKGYFAVAKVQEIVRDPSQPEMYLAIIEPGTYLDFGDPVPFRVNNEVIERGVLNDKGNISGRAQAALRTLSDADFSSIIKLGLGTEDGFLPRTGDSLEVPGFADRLELFDHVPVRERVDQINNRVIRDRNFRKSVVTAYGERCAITGLRLINSRGRAEVEAAHIRPVEHNGPDIVSNGIALSGTTHWMFDRGLVGVADDLTVLMSRQANDPDAVSAMINPTGKLIAPKRVAHRPRLEFVAWHREHCFKH